MRCACWDGFRCFGMALLSLRRLGSIVVVLSW